METEAYKSLLRLERELMILEARPIEELIHLVDDLQSLSHQVMALRDEVLHG